MSLHTDRLAAQPILYLNFVHWKINWTRLIHCGERINGDRQAICKGIWWTKTHGSGVASHQAFPGGISGIIHASSWRVCNHFRQNFYISRTSRYNTALKMEQLETLGCEFQLPSTQLVLRRPESLREWRWGGCHPRFSLGGFPPKKCILLV